MAAPVIAASGAAWTVNNTGGAIAASITLTKPTDATINSGDLLMMIVGNDDINPAAGEWNDVTGWTREFQIGNNTADAAMAVYWRIADTTEGATQAVTCDTDNELYGWYFHITGNDTITPMDANGPGTEYNATGTSHAVTGFTPAGDDRLFFAIGAFDGGDGHAFTVSGTGWGLGDSEQSGSLATDASGCWATKTITTAAASGTCTITSAVSDGLGGIQFAIASPVSSAPDEEAVATRSDFYFPPEHLIVPRMIPSSFHFPAAEVEDSGSGFPVVETTATDDNNLADDPFSFDLPAGIVDGDRLLMFYSGVVFPTTPTGWTQIGTLGGSTGAPRTRIFARDADGTEGASVSIDTGGFRGVSITYRLSNCHAIANFELSTVDGGASLPTLNPDPPNEAASFGPDNILWIAAVFGRGQNVDVTAIPSNYTDGVHQAGTGGTSTASAGSARRELNAAAENPGTFTWDTSVDWGGCTVAIGPA